MVLVDATHEQKATNVQTALLEALSRDVKAMDERIDVLCSHAGRLGHIQRDVAVILKSVQGVANGTDAVSSFFTGLNEHLDSIKLSLVTRPVRSGRRKMS